MSVAADVSGYFLSMTGTGALRRACEFRLGGMSSPHRAAWFCAGDESGVASVATYGRVAARHPNHPDATHRCGPCWW